MHLEKVESRHGFGVLSIADEKIQEEYIEAEEDSAETHRDNSANLAEMVQNERVIFDVPMKKDLYKIKTVVDIMTKEMTMEMTMENFWVK